MRKLYVHFENELNFCYFKCCFNNLFKFKLLCAIKVRLFMEQVAENILSFYTICWTEIKINKRARYSELPLVITVTFNFNDTLLTFLIKK